MTDAELRVHRIAALERAFDVSLTAEEKDRCVSPESMSVVFAERLRAVEGPGGLRRGALGAVRETLHGLTRVDRETVGESTPIARFFPSITRARRWRALGKELNCPLPPLRFNWIAASVALGTVGAEWVVTATFPGHPRVRDPVIAVSLAACFGAVAAVLTGGLLARFPDRLTTIGTLITRLVATRPANYRGGTEWTRGQTREVVDATHWLRSGGPGARG